MLWNITKLRGLAIEASDGRIGTISDFLFDDVSWSVRWLEIDTGHWLPGRKLLLPAVALRGLDADQQQFSVQLTKQQVKDSPHREQHQPVSRQLEADIFDHYGWSPYWGDGWYSTGFGPMQTPPIGEDGGDQRDTTDKIGDPHLRSTQEVTHYHLHARDGDIGHVSDFLIGDVDWSIHFLIVETGSWWSNGAVLISPRCIERVDWIKTEITVTIDRDAVRNSPSYSKDTIVDGAYEKGFHSYYAALPPQDGRPHLDRS